MFLSPAASTLEKRAHEVLERRVSLDYLLIPLFLMYFYVCAIRRESVFPDVLPKFVMNTLSVLTLRQAVESDPVHTPLRPPPLNPTVENLGKFTQMT